MLFTVPALACYFIISAVGMNIGDFLGSLVSSTDSQALVGLAMFLGTYAAFHRFGLKMLGISTVTSSPVPNAQLVYLIFAICFAVDLLFYFVFGFGRAGAQTSTSLSIFATLMPKDIALMLVLHLNANRPRRVLLIMAGFTAFALSLGWTGQFFTLFVTSLYIFRNRLRNQKTLVCALLVLGILAYPAIFSIKLGVRQGEAFDYNLLSVVHLASRLTGYPALIYLQGEQWNFLTSYTHYFDKFNYVIEPLLAIVPKSILGLQGSITLEKAIVDFVGGNSELTQFIWGLPTKLWFYWQVNALHFALFFLENFVIFWAAYAWARRCRDEFLAFYLFFLLGMYIWAGDISTLFVSLFRIAVFFMFYRALSAVLPRRRRMISGGEMAAPAGALR